MPASLQSLPIELIERVVVLLQISEVSTLRLVCSELRDKASQGCYLALFTHRNVDLTEPGLDGLTNALNTSELARKLRNLTLIGLCYAPQIDGKWVPKAIGSWEPPTQTFWSRKHCPSKQTRRKKSKKKLPEDLLQHRKDLADLKLLQAKHHWNVENGRYVDLLKAVFVAIKEKTVGHGLESLKLSFMVQTWLDFRNTPDALQWRCASSEGALLLSTTLDALAGSQLPVKHFDAFSAARQCNIALTELAAYLKRNSPISIRPFGSQVQSLAINFTPAPLEGTDLLTCCECNNRRFRRPNVPAICHFHQFEFEDENDSSCAYTNSLALLLSNFTNLVTLHLHEYEAAGLSENPTATFDHLSSTLTLPKLRHCTLRGLNVPDTALLTFLRHHPHLHTLYLDNINLTQGRWTRILSDLQSKLPNLTLLTLHDLYEPKRRDPLPNNAAANNPTAIGFVPVPIIPLGGQQTETLLNSLLGWRVTNDPEGEVEVGGKFGKNRLVLKGVWVQKCEVAYAPIGYANVREKVEARWEGERCREFGPMCEVFDIV